MVVIFELSAQPQKRRGGQGTAWHGGSSLPFSSLLWLSGEQYRKIEVPNKTGHGNMQIAPRYMNVEIKNEAEQFRFWKSIHILKPFFSVPC